MVVTEAGFCQQQCEIESVDLSGVVLGWSGGGEKEEDLLYERNLGR